MGMTASAISACPFCGHVGVSVQEGSTFRWRYASCDECGAQSCEIRIQTLGDGSKEEWEAKAREDAITEWNRRSHPAQDAALPDDYVTVRKLRSGDSPEKFAAWAAFYGACGFEIPHNADGTLSGTFAVAVNEAIQAYLKAAHLANTEPK